MSWFPISELSAAHEADHAVKETAFALEMVNTVSNNL